MPGTIINKKQHISVRAYWFQGGPGPACSIAINGTGVGTYTCPISAYNSCQLTTVRTYGVGMVEGLNSASAPKAQNVSVVRGNLPSCYSTFVTGRDNYAGTMVYSNQYFNLPYINTTSSITVTFNWTSSASWPFCCQRSENSDTSGYNYGYTHGVYFDIAYRYDDGSYDNAVSAPYTSLVTWAFSNSKTYQTGCSSTAASVSKCGGIHNGSAYGCTTFNPSNPSLTTVVIPCPTCG